MPTYEDLGFGKGAVAARDDSRALFGQVMGLVAFTAGFAALGAYVARNWQGGTGIIFFILAFASIFGLQFAASRGHEQLAVGLLFAMGLFLGFAVSPVIVYYATTNPGVVWQAVAATAGFIGILGAYGYASRRDFSPYYRGFFWALIGLLVFGLIATFVAIPHANIIYCVLGLVIFGAFTVFDFNRLARTRNMNAAPVIAASIFLDIFNVFLFFLSLFGGGGNRR
jgi:FtsH-binding integral membrane protein